MKNKKLTVEQIIRIYQLKTQNKTWGYIATATGAGESAAYKSYQAMADYLGGGLIKSVSPVYKEAYDFLRGSRSNGIAQSPTEVSSPPPTPTVDRFTKIEQAFNNFQQAIVDFVEEEAVRRAEQKIAEKERELQVMTEKIEKMATALDEAKQSNVVGFLRKRFGNP